MDVTVLGERLARETVRVRSVRRAVHGHLVDVSAEHQWQRGPAELADVPVAGAVLFGGAQGDRTIVHEKEDRNTPGCDGMDLSLPKLRPP
jgi:hypothetical protein